VVDVMVEEDAEVDVEVDEEQDANTNDEMIK
jgi:hypothetical protein